MWGSVESSVEYVAKYTTVIGQFWYLLLFVFRLIVVVTIAGEVYKDEQSSFRCSTKAIGCENVCYNRFAKISHIRFWAFQILALATPVVIFHFYSLAVEGRISEYFKSKKSNSKTDDKKQNSIQDKVGKIKTRKVFNRGKFQAVHFNNDIRIAYFFSVLARFTIEFVFLYLAFDLFTFAKYHAEMYEGVISSERGRVESIFDLFWLTVPQLYRCSGNPVRWACGQHMLPGNSNGYVPCWVSRPWEKTWVLRYMNFLSLIGLILCFSEIILLLLKLCKMCNRKVRSKSSDYEKVSSEVSNDYDEKTKSGHPDGDKYYTFNETEVNDPKKPEKNQPSAKSASNNVKNLSDDESFSARLEVVKNSEKPIKNSNRKPSIGDEEQTGRKRVFTSEKRRYSNQLPNVTDEDGKKQKEFNEKDFAMKPGPYPNATQSLTRPHKFPHTVLFNYPIESFSLSEEDDDDLDEGSSSSSEESELDPVSDHSSENYYKS